MKNENTKEVLMAAGGGGGLSFLKIKKIEKNS